MKFLDLSTLTAAAPRNARWALVYATADQALETVLANVSAKLRGATVFGCTSSGGVFTPRGFERGAFALVAEGEVGDPRLEVASRRCGATQARAMAREAARAITSKLGRRPDALLLHATPGFEERLIEGIIEAFEGSAPPVYGGSAADDDLSGRWKVFAGTQIETEGFVLGAFVDEQPLYGSFVAGYVPGKEHGVVTRSRGRVVYEIDGQPAAEVYNRWRGGELDDYLAKGGVVLASTTLNPIGRVIDRVGAVPRYLLSHPHEIGADRSLSFFTEFANGDEIVMMVGSKASLLERTEQVIARALGHGRSRANLRGGILVYCGGCVMAIGDGAKEVATLYHRGIGSAPFVGAATFGEIGCFTGPTPVNRHGNLMCDTILFA